MLTRDDLLGHVAAPFTPGLVLVDWRGQDCAEAMTELLALHKVASLPVEVSELLPCGEIRDRQIDDAIYATEIALQIGLTPVIFASYASHPMTTEAAHKISEGLAAIIRRISRRPAFMVVAGSASATAVAHVLGFKNEAPMGEIRPGIPVLRLSGKGQFPGLPFVVINETHAKIDLITAIVRELRERK